MQLRVITWKGVELEAELKEEKIIRLERTQ
jgi:hypothetical protein